MPPDAPRPAHSDDQATVPGAVSRTLTSRSAPPGAGPVPGAKEKLAAATQVSVPASTQAAEGTLAEPPDPRPNPQGVSPQVWVWAAVGALVALGLGALLLI